jgi:hypothetical protein
MLTSRHIIAALLGASAFNLTLMIPGGFVETRDFSTYPAIVLGAFNIFLTILGLGSFLLAYHLLKKDKGYRLSALVGLAFIGVYLLDLGGIFPVPPTPMSMLLATLEWIGTGLAITLLVAATALSRHATGNTETSATPLMSIPVILGLVVIALVIIAFATKSAMGL